jgi:hypothetical protein
MSDRILVGTRKGLFTLRRQDQIWRITDRHFLGDPVNLVLHDRRDDHVYAALDTGHFGAKLHRSSDGGATFEEIAVPVYPEKPAGEEDISAIQREEVEWKLKAMWALETGGADEDGNLWCGTTPGGLFVSADRGATWELVRSLWDHPLRKSWFGGGTVHPALHSICVDPRNSARVVIAVSCGGVWQTEDRGETWELTAKGMTANYLPPEDKGREENQDPHCMVQCRRDPDHYWVQHHNGIFKSIDGARTWSEVTDVSPSSFGFPVVVHPEESGTAWFVPAVRDQARYPADGAVVVNRTRDGGATFTTLREGLPQENAYDLVFRHALALSRDGERLAFGSTTGGLWVSENQGDSWTEISAHLPPVYCVRFG